MNEVSEQKLNKENFLRPIIWGVLSGWVLIGLPWLIYVTIANFNLILANKFNINNLHQMYSLSIFGLLPFVQGFFTRSKRSNRVNIYNSGLILLPIVLIIDILFASIILREGTICLVMAFPFILAFMAIGYSIANIFEKRKNNKTLNVTIIPLLIVLTISDVSASKPSFENAISDTVTINAPPEFVWKYVVEQPINNTPSDYWLWDIGLPMPIHSVAPIKEIGKRRDCKFSGNIAFEEEITALEPNKLLTFKVTKQPQDPEIIGHFNLIKGQMYLEKNDNATTSIIATSWYTIHVKPVNYFDFWASDITRKVHFRVLNHIKALAERDYKNSLTANP